jgi:hypothetical protein
MAQHFLSLGERSEKMKKKKHHNERILRIMRLKRHRILHSLCLNTTQFYSFFNSPLCSVNILDPNILESFGILVLERLERIDDGTAPPIERFGKEDCLDSDDFTDC